MMFAEATNSELGAWLYAAATIAQLVATITVLITLNSKQRREITFAGVPVDKTDFDKHVQENREVHTQLFAKLSGVQRAAETTLHGRERDAVEGRRQMHETISTLGERVAGVETQTEMIEKRTAQIDTKVDRLIERMNDSH